MGNKKLSDFIRNNISDSDFEEEEAKYPAYDGQEPFVEEEAKYPKESYLIEEELKYPLKVPYWFSNVKKITSEWRKHLEEWHPYKGFTCIDNDFNIEQHLKPVNTFSLSYRIDYYLKPIRPFEYQDVSLASKDYLQEIIAATYGDLQHIYTYHDKKESHGGYEHWHSYELPKWKEYKDVAEEFKKSFDDMVAAQEATYKEACDSYLESTSSVTNMASFVLLRNPLPPFFGNYFVLNYDLESNILQVDFMFPNYKDVDIVIGRSDNGKIKYASATAKRKIIKETLYSLIIWRGYLLASHLKDFDLAQIAINVEQYWFDPATGKQVTGVIASVLGATDYFRSLNIEHVDPIACMRQLKGITTPSLENQSPIRPIFDLNMNDKRVVDSKDIDGTLEEGENLAAMPWEDFEQLVGQLFGWEFAKDGAEVKVTQASRDRGVDAILFDPDPIRGGKYVIQAKRYTRTVDVASVRDLYGTIMNEGANRGILITTSSYGPDSYEFAKDKPISLVDGPNLIQMLRKHGKNYKIDLKEARDILGLDT